MSTAVGALPVFVTGAGAGIGAAVVRRLAARGGRVLVSDVDPASAAVATDAGGEFHRFDVADRVAWRAVADRVRAEHGRLAGLVLNVGGGTADQPVDVLTVSDEAIDRAVAVNVGGVLNGLRALGPLLEPGPANVVVMASVRGIWPGPMDPFYSMTKHALVGFVRSAAPGLVKRGIRINAVCPGPTLTPATEKYLQGDAYYGAAPWQSADAVAALVVDLLEATTSGGVYRVLDGTVTRLRLPRPQY